MKPPMFLLSSERSGTNLLRRRLTEYQSEYFGPAPLHFLKHLYWAEPYYGNLETDENFEVFIQDALGLAYHHFSPWDEKITIGQVKSEYTSYFSGGRTSIGVMHVIYMIYAHRKGYISYFCKDNNLFDFASDIKLELPDAKFVYLYRDPRDVIVSQVKRPLQNKSICYLSELWRDEQIKCIRYSDLLSRYHDVFFLSYEELIKDENGKISALCSFLGVDIIAEKVGFSSKEKTDIQEWMNIDKPTIKNNSGKFRDNLSISQIERIESICWHQMRKLGYEPIVEQRKSINSKRAFLEALFGKLWVKITSKFVKAGVTLGQKNRSSFVRGLQKKWR